MEPSDSEDVGGHQHIPHISSYGVGSSKEGDRLAMLRLLQQDCLWRMLPLLFAAGHHWYARYTIAFLQEMQNLPAAAKSDIMSGAHV